MLNFKKFREERNTTQTSVINSQVIKKPPPSTTTTPPEKRSILSEKDILIEFFSNIIKETQKIKEGTDVDIKTSVAKTFHYVDRVNNKRENVSEKTIIMPGDIRAFVDELEKVKTDPKFKRAFNTFKILENDTDKRAMIIRCTPITNGTETFSMSIVFAPKFDKFSEGFKNIVIMFKTIFKHETTHTFRSTDSSDTIIDIKNGSVELFQPKK